MSVTVCVNVGLLLAAVAFGYAMDGLMGFGVALFAFAMGGFAFEPSKP
jgi:divalent metal cation (Fe/Co/Zn/Cd) transporter